MEKRIVGLFFKSDWDRSADLARDIISADYGRYDIQFIIGEDVGTENADASCRSESLFEHMEFAVSIGGDGTFLRTTRAVRELGVPLYGINAGRLGFLASGNPQSAVEDIRKILSGHYGIMARIPLKGEVMRDGKQIEDLYALNEVTISKGTTARPIDLHVAAGHESLYRFLADGIIVSTPTGSTAYSLSAGGPVVHPDVKCMLVVPICPHSLYPRPVVLGENETIVIEPMGENGEIILSGDGQLHVELRDGDSVRLSLDLGRSVNVIKLDSTSYYDVLQSKLGWGVNNTFFKKDE